MKGAARAAAPRRAAAPGRESATGAAEASRPRCRGALAVAVLALTLLLGACTGTFEDTEPLLLVAGIEDAGGAPQVVLIEDRFSPVQSTADRLALLEASRRPLAYPAVDADVTDRDGQRPELVLLTRELDAAAPRSELRFYTLEGIDPDDPVAFATSPLHPTVALTGAPGAVLDAEVGPGACPSALQASRTGRYVAVLDNRRACSGVGTDLVTLFLIDVTTTPPSVVFTSGGQPVMPAAPFLDQAATDEHLYYLVSGINDMRVYRMTLPDGNAAQYLGLALPGSDASVLRADREALVALGSSQLHSVELAADAAAATVSTVSDSRALAVDATGTTAQLVVVGENRTYVHADPQDADPADLPIFGRAAAIDPLNRFAYVMRDQVLYIVDLLAIASDSPGGLYVGTSLPGLLLPTHRGAPVGVLEWTRAVTAPTP